MRVISGMYRGRTLKTVKDHSVRPATDRVKQTIFDILAHRITLAGSRVLDLFAGSGSLGIEALSRGASQAVFVESNAEAVEFIKKNLTLLGCIDRAEVHIGDAVRFVEMEQRSFDVVFADPPYEFEHTRSLPQRIFSRGLVRQGGYLLVEHTSSMHFEQEDLIEAGPIKKFGRTIVTFFRHSPREVA